MPWYAGRFYLRHLSRLTTSAPFFAGAGSLLPGSRRRRVSSSVLVLVVVLVGVLRLEAQAEFDGRIDEGADRVEGDHIGSGVLPKFSVMPRILPA